MNVNFGVAFGLIDTPIDTNTVSKRKIKANPPAPRGTPRVRDETILDFASDNLRLHSG